MVYKHILGTILLLEATEMNHVRATGYNEFTKSKKNFLINLRTLADENKILLDVYQELRLIHMYMVVHNNSPAKYLMMMADD